LVKTIGDPLSTFIQVIEELLAGKAVDEDWV